MMPEVIQSRGSVPLRARKHMHRIHSIYNIRVLREGKSEHSMLMVLNQPAMGGRRIEMEKSFAFGYFSSHVW